MTDLPNYSPHIILLNETSCTNNNIKLQGYSVVQKCEEANSGVAILVRHHINYTLVNTKDTNTLAIKLYTTIGPIIISTSYIPPRINFIPTIALNKLLDHNLPTLFFSDFNSHHPYFHNTIRGHPYGDNKGTQLFNLATARRLSFMGPLFHTYYHNRARGTPDIALCNDKFSIFHYNLTQGNNIYPDHIPVILKLSLQPIKIPIQERLNLKTLRITDFKNTLASDQFQELDGQPVETLDNTVSNIFNNINTAISENCQTTKIRTVSIYTPTPQIRLNHLTMMAAV